MPVTIRRLGPGDEPVLRLLAEEAPDFDLPGRAPQPPLSAEDADAYLSSAWVLHWSPRRPGTYSATSSAT